MQIQTRQGEEYVLDTRVGSGGEAQIWGVRNQPQLVAKMYREPSREREAKLLAMLTSPPSVQQAVAWPTALLYRNRTFAGFLMKRVEGHLPIFSVYNPVSRRRLRTSFHWRHFLHHTALNLSTVVASVHASGHVIGDLNESNVLVDQRALVTLIDTDSFQIRAPNGQLFRSPVGKAEFTPPELQGVDFKSVDRAPAHDHFALSVLLFLLLMEGVHPFAGVPTEEPPSGRVDLHGIRHGLFPHHTSNSRIARRVTPPPGAPDFGQLHPALQELFVHTFVDGHDQPDARAGAHEWRDALLTAKDALVECPDESDHVYSSHLGSCPQCQAVQQARKQARAEEARRKREAVLAGVRRGLKGANPMASEGKPGAAPEAQSRRGYRHPQHATASIPPHFRPVRKPSAHVPAAAGPLERAARAWHNTVPWLELGLLWTVTNGVGMPLLFALNVHGLTLSQSLYTETADDSTALFMVMLLGGLVLGWLQSAVLRSTLLRSQRRRLQWIGTTMLACAVGGVAGSAVVVSTGGGIWGGAALLGVVGLGQGWLLRGLSLDVRKRRVWTVLHALMGAALSWLWSVGDTSALALAVIGGSGVLSAATLSAMIRHTRFAPSSRRFMLPRRFQLRWKSGKRLQLRWKSGKRLQLRWKIGQRLQFRWKPWKALRLRPVGKWVGQRWWLGALLPLLIGLFLLGQSLFEWTNREIRVRASEPASPVSAPPLMPIHPSLGDER